MIKKIQRLNSKNVHNLLKKGFKLQTPEFLIRFLKNNLKVNRYTVIISKKILPKAVQRNQLRRKIFEILRLHDENLSTKADIAIIAKRELNLTNLKYNILEKKITSLYSSISSKNAK